MADTGTTRDRVWGSVTTERDKAFLATVALHPHEPQELGGAVTDGDFALFVAHGEGGNPRQAKPGHDAIGDRLQNRAMPFVQVAGLDIDPSRAGLPHELAAFDLRAWQTDLAQHGMSESHVLAGLVLR